MILIDSRVGSKDLLPYIQRLNIPCRLTELEFGDACFEGNGPDGRIIVGIERKKLSDMLNCIDDARYAGHQRPGMFNMYSKSMLMIEGVWKPDAISGYLMECVAQMTWKPYRYRSLMVRYHKLFRYLLSVQLSGVLVIQTRDAEHTAYNIVECFQYFSKKWDQHTSMMEIHRLNIPDMRTKPTLVRRWASDIEGIGVKHSMEAEKIFRTPYHLAKSDEMDWIKIPGIGASLARKIIREIHGIMGDD